MTNGNGLILFFFTSEDLCKRHHLFSKFLQMYTQLARIRLTELSTLFYLVALEIEARDSRKFNN